MQTFNVLYNGQLIGTEQVIPSMTHSAVKLLLKRLGYPVGCTIKRV
jgi:hypothetical protein